MAQYSITDSIDNHFYNIEHEMDQRFHSLEIELDSLVDSTCLKIFNSKSICKMFRKIRKARVGELLYFNCFYKVKSIDFVDYCGIIPNDIPYYPFAFRNGILHVLTWRKDTYDFTIYYSTTNVVTFSFIYQGDLRSFSLDDSKIYFHSGDKVKYICDYDGKNALTNRYYESYYLNPTVDLLSAVFFRLVSIHFNDLYVIVRTCDYFVFFHKNTMLFSHQIKITFDDFTDEKISCMGDYFLHVYFYYMYYKVFYLNGLQYERKVDEVEDVNFKCHLFDGGVVKEYCLEERDYTICEIKGNCIWFRKKDRGIKDKLIKMVF